MIDVLRAAGVVPQHWYHLLAAVPPLLAWWLTRRWAKQRRIVRYHNAALAVSFWEEALFRGIVYGGVLAVTESTIFAIIVSSALFGLFHLRNLWWADKKRVLFTCLYTGLLIGPILALLRSWTGDIYLGIAAHYLNNFVFMLQSRNIPTDTDLERT